MLLHGTKNEHFGPKRTKNGNPATIRKIGSDVMVIKIVYRDVVVLFYVLRKKALRFRFDLEHDNDRPEVIFFLSK